MKAWMSHVLVISLSRTGVQGEIERTAHGGGEGFCQKEEGRNTTKYSFEKVKI